MIDINELVSANNADISELRKLRPSETTISKVMRECTVQVAVAEPGKFQLDIAYIVNNASWEPSYAIRVNSEKNQATLVFNGSVSNRSNDDWDDFELTLSTATPSKAGSPPPVPVYDIYLYEPSDTAKREKSARKKESKRSKSVTNTVSIDDVDFSALATATKHETKVHKSMLAANYTIDRSCSIPSDTEQARKVTIAFIDLDIDFEYLAIPWLTTDVYLKADTTNTSDYTLLPGDMNVFMDDYYLTKTKLEATHPGQPMLFFLGVESGIECEVVIDDSNAEKTSGGIMSKAKQTETKKRRIKLKNNTADRVYHTFMLILDKTTRIRTISKIT